MVYFHKSRLHGLNQIVELLSTLKYRKGENAGCSVGSPCVPAPLFNSAHLQIMSGCFGVGLALDEQENGENSNFHHYHVGFLIDNKEINY